MKTFYLVVNRVYDNGKSTAELKKLVDLDIPKDNCMSFSNYDIYRNFFENKEDAEIFYKNLIE